MEVTVPVNNHYYENSFFSENDLKNRFGTRGKKFEAQKNRLFSSVFELTTHHSNLKKLKLFGFKDLKGKKEEERLILKLYSKEHLGGEKQYIVQTGLYAGVIYHKGCKFNITTRYGDAFLRRMLNFVNDIYIDNQKTPSSKNQKVNDFEFIIAYLFIQSFEKAAVLGLPHEYQTLTQKSNKVRGKVDINTYIKTNIPFRGSITSTYREQVYIQEVVDVLYLTCKKLESKFGREIHRRLLSITQLLKQHYSGRFTSKDTILKAKSHRALHNPMYASFRKVLEYAEIILLQLELDANEEQNRLETYGFLFDISQLFELYLEKLLSKHFSEWDVNSQEELPLYKSMFYGRRMFPDIVMKHKSSGKIAVFDAKFKTMRMLKDDLDRSDFYQIHTYMHYYGSNVMIGGLIYPLSEQLNSAKAHSESLFGNNERKETKFIVDGVHVSDDMDMSHLIQQEDIFLSRLGKNLVHADYLD
ncbi:McrC family protein [Pontibacter oryzae]|uniref:Restriction endonuclease n=1 Tax=Pontibacter oryzae TaxID=2304593 RepID=A0A399SHZ3_9BACT|nr:hypothetical protein [Pontibacter oryzae]RIJ42654.1 hypothetical protein D1627_02020 [Pontibacter oryzae]